MKKAALSSLLTALVITATATTALAAEAADNRTLSVSGEATLQWERVKPKADPDSHTGEQTFILNFSQPLSDNVSAYARFAYRNFGGDNIDDSIHEVDQFGLIYEAPGGTLTLGSQEAELGTLSGLADLTEVGRDNMFRGATWASESEQKNLKLLVGKVDKNLLETNNNKTVTGLEVSKVFGDVTVSGEYLHVSNNPSVNSVYGLGLKTAVDKWEFAFEGLRSSADQAASGMLAGVTYAATEKETISATYRNLKANSVVTGLATYDANTKGIELAWEKSLTDRWSVKLSHEWAKTIDTQNKERIAAIETTYTF
ncbi:hypothetical protein AXX12_10535 [Anaerosporomusa subterranea]|uniref:Porin domain-containing protein n=1 Tax=Anaerosporomusa subterranea TaxID=1794912 RepID=A0A154BNQ8_ANASB|nr:porin [Anaerosporomusa subterranea]KYZ75643.1 hypothetical protein AXX12_10535 [Anaerosporomusa subterranea]